MNDLQELLKSALSHAYDIERELPGGGMSRVFVAIERALGRQVVIKVLPPELGAGVNTERFRREIQLSAQLNHPHIVPVLSAGEIGELLYYTMPYIEGESLNITVEKNGRLDSKEVLRILHDVVDAISYAHSRGVIHRDIKPANILTLGNHALVTDFGVAKAISASLPSTGMTSGGFAIGTPAYMAPEQLAADPQADHRIDIYAVGLLAYELLTGTSPFTSTSPQATMAAQLTRVPAPLHKVRPDVPAVVSDLIQRCLEKLPENRPSTAQELLRELDEISTPQGTLTFRRTTLRAAFADPAKHARYLAAVVALTVLVGGSVFAAATVLIDNANANGNPNSAGVAATPSDSSEDKDVLARNALTTKELAPEPVASLAITEQEFAAFADSIRTALRAEFTRDSAALSDSLRESIIDSLARIRSAMRSGGDRNSRGGTRGPIDWRRPLAIGEKRVLVADFAVPRGQSDTTRLGARLADSLRTALRRGGSYLPVSSREARAVASSDDPRVMVDAVHAGAVLFGNAIPRRGDSLVIRLSISEPSAQQPRPLGSFTTSRTNVGAAITALLPAVTEALGKVTWPAGREGSRGRRGGGATGAGPGVPPRGAQAAPPPGDTTKATKTTTGRGGPR